MLLKWSDPGMDRCQFDGDANQIIAEVIGGYRQVDINQPKEMASLRARAAALLSLLEHARRPLLTVT